MKTEILWKDLKHTLLENELIELSVIERAVVYKGILSDFIHGNIEYDNYIVAVVRTAINISANDTTIGKTYLRVVLVKNV